MLSLQINQALIKCKKKARAVVLQMPLVSEQQLKKLKMTLEKLEPTDFQHLYLVKYNIIRLLKCVVN